MDDVFEISMNSTKEIQKRVYQNKVRNGFNITNIDREFCLLYCEISEAFDAYRKRLQSVGEELADISIYLLGLAEMLDVDLGVEIDRKIQINEQRTYTKDENGVLIRMHTNSEKLIEHYFPDGMK